MPAYFARPSAPTNLTLHEAIEIGGPVACGDAAVFPGDIMLGDGDGVMVIPAHLADPSPTAGRSERRISLNVSSSRSAVASRSSPTPGASARFSKLMFGAMTRAAERWRAIRFTDFERRQIATARKDLDAEYTTADTTPSTSHKARTANEISSSFRT
jgi:hypothetical protein